VSKKTQGVKDHEAYTKGAEFERNPTWVKKDTPELSIVPQIEATANEVVNGEGTLRGG
jgi:hypothetical protein